MVPLSCGNQEAVRGGVKGARIWGRWSQYSLCAHAFLCPVSFWYQVWIEWDACDVPGPVLSVRYRMMTKKDILCLHREFILKMSCSSVRRSIDGVLFFRIPSLVALPSQLTSFPLFCQRLSASYPLSLSGCFWGPSWAHSSFRLVNLMLTVNSNQTGFGEGGGWGLPYKISRLNRHTSSILFMFPLPIPDWWQ